MGEKPSSLGASEFDDGETVDLSRLAWVALPPGPRALKPQRSFPGADFLVGSDSRAILQRITHGDPLGLEGRCESYLRSSAYLIDRERLITVTLAHVARAALRYRGEPALSAWLSDLIEGACADILTEDVEAVRESEPTAVHDTRYRFISDALGVDPSVAQRATAVFNDLPGAVRRDFWAVVVERNSVDERCAVAGSSRFEVEGNVRRAIVAISMLRDPGERPWNGGLAP